MIKYFSKKSDYISIGSAVFLLFLSARFAPADSNNLFNSGTFDNTVESYNPWAGVDGEGNIHGIDGSEYAVSDDGTIAPVAFGPSVAVGDLNGDGRPDLVVADARGYFWFYPNTGTKTAPRFGQGQIMPIWLGDVKVDVQGAGTDTIVPRIQLVDFNGSGMLSIVAGTYSGKLFYIPNIGTPTVPNFPVTTRNESYMVNTRDRGRLWCNYLSPFLYPWFNRNVLDLIMGEGTYSANSIYLFKNMNANVAPVFNETHVQKIIPGMGLEQLVPTVLDWNGDGKPDILAADRGGYLNLFLNTSTDPAHPTFAPAKHITVGGLEKLGNSITVSVGDLTGSKLPNLLIGSEKGTILYAINTGKPGAPEFSKPLVPLKGVNPYPKTIQPVDWYKSQPAGVPFEMITSTNPTLEPTLKFPDGMTNKYALKFSVYPIVDLTFPKRYYPFDEAFFREHVLSSSGSMSLLAHKKYKVHVWAKAGPGIQNLYILFNADYRDSKGFHQNKQTTMTISAGSAWSSNDRDLDLGIGDWDKNPMTVTVQYRFKGQGTLYLADMTVTEE